MPYLLRKFSNKDAWAEVENSPLWEQGDCPPEALVQVFDNRAGVSTWRVSTEEEVERVIAAQAFMRGTIGDFAYCLIDEDILRKDGIQTKNTPAKTMDKEPWPEVGDGVTGQGGVSWWCSTPPLLQ
jgi:hypothetical protein